MLIAVHVVMIAHVGQWLLQGVTLSPVEPSEGMEFAKHGIVNTGLVFFIAAILVTAVFGRFFCGWGCHLIALQDLSRWILIKLGMRPRPLRSRLLGLVPLIAFVYMFLWPAIYKLAVGEPLGPVRASFLTSDFWVTFPGLIVAVLTFAICGFAVVFVLGSKGYCTYGCPYGAAFAVADRLAPIRVRVTDACKGCATCTSVCTSNVRVHEEVREHGMVVDPGCMKCLDCVANCPNDALYVGVGSPSLGRKGPRRGPGSLAWTEEVAAGTVFVLAFFAFRGLYGVVPFLMALGVAGAIAGMATALLRLIRREEAWLGPVRLKKSGRVGMPGLVLMLIMLGVIALSAHSAFIQLASRRADNLYELTGGLRTDALEIQRRWSPPVGGDRQLVGDARRAVQSLEQWSPVGSPRRIRRLAWLAFLDGDLIRAKERVDQALLEHPSDPEVHVLAARILVAEGRFEMAARAYAQVVELDPGDASGYLGLGTIHGQTGRFEEARKVFELGLAAVPGSMGLCYNLGLSKALSGDLNGAIFDFERVLESDPHHLPARENLAGALAGVGRFAEAANIYEEAVQHSPGDAQLRIMAARASLGAGRRDRAEEHIEAAIRLDPTLEPARSLLD